MIYVGARLKKAMIILLLLVATFPVYSLAKTIVVLSDCLGSAYGFDPALNWVTGLGVRLKNMHSSYQVINISHGGDTTEQGLEKLPQALLDYNPSMVIIALGGNDGLRGLSPDFIENNLMRMIALIQKQGAELLVVRFSLPMNYGPVYQKRFRNIFEKLDNVYHLKDRLIDIQSLEKAPEKKQWDRIHPTADAQGEILEALWPLIKKNLKE